MELLEQINLTNGLTLNIFDLSRPIAADTVKVELSMQIKVVLEKAYFANNQDYIDVKNVFGEELTFDHKTERTIVSKKDENTVREELLATFKNNLLKYLASENFSQMLALSVLRDIKNNPYKYQSHHQTETE
jgi:hypothetical protein